MARRSRLFRWAELTLLVAGVSLLGVAFGATLDRWTYQVQQGRALFERGPAVPSVNDTRFEPVAVEPADTLHLSEPAPDETPSLVEQPRKRGRKRIAETSRAADVDLTALGRLEIPRLGLAAIVKEGDDERTLARAIALVPGSARPGEAGNMVLAGHRDSFFRPLRKIKLNDRIRLVVPPRDYEYEVQSVRVVEPGETSVLESHGVEELTLVTCYPFGFVGPAPQRFIVTAARVN